MNVQINVTLPFANRVPAVQVMAMTPPNSGQVPVVAVDKTASQTPCKPVHRLQLEKLLVGMHGKFVGVDFVKADGSIRSLNGRLGVRCHLRGGDNTVCAADRPYITIYDVKSKGYRTLNLATVSEVRAQHTKFLVIG